MIMGVILGYFSAPGGVGKTVLSLLTGWNLRDKNYRVLLMDLDPSISLSLYVIRDAIELVNYEKRGRTLTYVLEKVLDQRVVVDIRDYIISKPFPSPKDPPIDIIIPDMRLANKVDTIWFGSEAKREEKLRFVFEKVGLRNMYDFIVIDTIPFYDRKYVVLLLYTADYCVVPLRPTIIDVYRTVLMLRELPYLTGMEAKELFSRIGVVFNMKLGSSSREEKLISKAKEIFRMKVSPYLHIFEYSIPRRVAFERFGTEEEEKNDKKTVSENIKPYIDELLEWLNKS